MKQLLLCGVLLAAVSPGFVRAQTLPSAAVVVTLRLATNTILIGGTTKLTVEARVASAFRTNSDRLFSWYIDLVNANPAIASANYAALTRPSSDRNPALSGPGTTDSTNSGLRYGIHDTFVNDPNHPGPGVANPVILFEVPILALAEGVTEFQVRAGTGVPALGYDFLVMPASEGEFLSGGDYILAKATLHVTAINPPVTRLRLTNHPASRLRIVQFAAKTNYDCFMEYRNLTLGATWQLLPGGPHNTVPDPKVSAPSPEYRGFSVTDTDSVAARFYRLRAVARP